MWFSRPVGADNSRCRRAQPLFNFRFATSCALTASDALAAISAIATYRVLRQATVERGAPQNPLVVHFLNIPPVEAHFYALYFRTSPLPILLRHVSRLCLPSVQGGTCGGV
jgi:hypothetical protein